MRKRNRGGGRNAPLRELARARARERGVLGREENATRDAVTRVPETGRVASRRERARGDERAAVAYLFPPLSANRLSPSLYLAIIDSLPPSPRGGRVAPFSRVLASRFSRHPPTRLAERRTFAPRHHLFTYSPVIPVTFYYLSYPFLPLFFCADVPVTRSLSCLPASHAKPSTVRAVSPCASLRLRPSSHTAVTFANVHCYHATALAPPPGTEGEINESKVRREGS